MRKISLLTVSALWLSLLACHRGTPQTEMVNAGFFQQVDYYPGQRLLTIHFSDGSVYAYQEVPKRVFDQLVKSPTPGGYFNDAIRDTYPFELLHVRTALGVPQVQMKMAEKPQDEFPCLDPQGANKKPIKSVILDFAAYDSRNHCMILYFDKGYIYEYATVTPQTFNALMHAPHVDKFFNRDIWGKYPTRRVRKP